MLSGHSTHRDDPVAYVPRGQLWHVLGVLAPISLDTIPFLHGTQCLLPGSVWYVPGLHHWHPLPLLLSS